jgi:multicomponent Na+:H+ antiporter subunit G
MVLDVIAAGLIALGLLLATIGLYGLLRFPDIFHQLHPAGLVTGPAVLLVLLAAVATGSAEIITSAALVLLFVLVTSPLSTHAIAQAARRRPRRPEDGTASGGSEATRP